MLVNSFPLIHSVAKKGKRNAAAMGNGWLIGMAESSDYREWTAEGETSLDGELCCMPLSTESFKAWLGKDRICDRKDIVWILEISNPDFQPNWFIARKLEKE